MIRPPERVEGGDVESVGGGGEHRRAPRRVGDALGQLVGASRVSAHKRDGEPARLVDHHHARVGLLVREERGQDPGGGAEREVGDDEVALLPRPHQPLGGRAVVAAGGGAEGGVDRVGVPARGVRVGHLPDHRRLAVSRLRGGVVEDEHHVRLRHLGDGGLLGAQLAHPLIRLPEPLRDHVAPRPPGELRGQLADPGAGPGQHRDLGVPPRRRHGVVDGAAVRGDHEGVVPGQRDGGERGRHRADRRRHREVEPLLAEAADDAVESGVAAGQHQRVVAVGQGLQPFHGGAERAEDDPALVGHAEGVEMAAPADDERHPSGEAPGGRRDLAEVAVNVDHRSSSRTPRVPCSRRSACASGSAARYSCRKPGW